LVLALGLAAEVAKADFAFGPPTEVPNVNTSSEELNASISADGLSLYFISNRPGGVGGRDIWVTTRETTDHNWAEPTNLGPTINTPAGEWGVSISSDGLSLYFDTSQNGSAAIDDLWVATRATTEDDWSNPVSLGPTVNSGADDYVPSISADGLALYFTSGPGRGGYGNYDLWVTTRATKDDPWGTPENLGPTVNSSAYDLDPGISSDGRTLFFARGYGTGQTEIWVTRRATTDDPWGEPMKLGSTINRLTSQGYPNVSADGSTLFFRASQSDRHSGGDIWQAPIVPVVDFNGDGLVTLDDLAIMFDNWHGDEPWCDIGPLPWGDGIVDVHDLMALAEYMPGIRTPPAKAADVPCDVTLSWIGSPLADTYDLYFGRSLEDVTNADRASPMDALVSEDQDTALYDPPALLEFGQTYYWRIDEVSATAEPGIHRGVVWSFTTEPFAYPIENVTATSNAVSASGEGPENTINGSGLDAADQHSIAAGDMWLGAPDGADPVYIQYEFDKVYRLHEMLVWNYNVQFEPVLGFGLKDVTVEYSENGADWTVLGEAELAQATATPTYAANTTVDLGGVVARYIRLTVNSGWGVMGSFGLSEIRFLHVPERAYESEAVEN